MSSKLIIAAVAGVVVIGAGALGVLAMRDKNESSSANQSPIESSQQTSTDSKVEQASIDTLLARGTNQKCTFSTSAGDTATDGTIYFSNKRLSSEFISKDATKTTQANMIITDGTQWLWDTATKRGAKFSLSLQQSSQSTQNTSQGLDTKQNYEFNCTNWQVEEARFTPPADVTFTDLSNIQSLQDIRVGQ